MSALSPEEIRIIGLSAPQLITMLRAREERILGKLFGDYKNGQTKHLTTIAEWACIRDQINEITRTLSAHHKQETKRHADTKHD